MHQPEPPKELYAKIMRRIAVEERRAVRLRRSAWSLGLAGSVAGGFAAARALAASASASGFSAYVSLLFTDGRSVAAMGGDYLLAVLESFPVSDAIVVCSLALTALWSLRAFLRAPDGRSAAAA